MAIVSGVNIPDNKRVEISLRSIYGIGPIRRRISSTRLASLAIASA